MHDGQSRRKLRGIHAATRRVGTQDIGRKGSHQSRHLSRGGKEQIALAEVHAPVSTRPTVDSSQPDPMDELDIFLIEAMTGTEPAEQLFERSKLSLGFDPIHFSFSGDAAEVTKNAASRSGFTLHFN
jgi:hypothetical protein